MKDVKESYLHKHALWMLTTLLGFALREALLAMFKREPGPPVDNWTLWLDFHRFLLMMLTCSAFLFGAARYFEEKAASEDNRIEARSEYFMDFLMAIIHFSIIFTLATTTTLHDGAIVSPFLRLAWTTSAYNVVWMFCSGSARNNPLAWEWTISGTIALLVSIVSLAAAKYFTFDAYVSEHAALAPFVFYRFYDLLVTMSGSTPFQPLVRFMPNSMLGPTAEH